jgi:hypothetical protein
MQNSGQFSPCPSSVGSSRNSETPTAGSSHHIVPSPAAVGHEDQIASPRQQEPVDPPAFLRRAAPPAFSSERLERIHSHGPRTFAGTGSSRHFTGNSDTAQFISNIRDKKLQAMAIEKMGQDPTPVRLEEIQDDGPNPMMYLPSSYKTCDATAIEEMSKSASSHRDSASKRVSVDPPAAIIPDLVIASSQSPYVPTAEATPISSSQPSYFAAAEATLITGSNQHLIRVQTNPSTTEKQRISDISMNPSDCADAAQASRNSGVSAFNHSENAVRASHESNQAGDEGETQDYNQEEDIESSTHGSYQEKPPAFWEVHKKKLIYGGVIAVAFTALVGILAVVLGDGGENKKGPENVPKIPETPTPSSSPSSPICNPLYESTEPCTPVNVNITFDDYPGETSWELYKVSTFGDDVLVMCHGNTDIATPPIDLCLEGGRYNFTIVDRDGLCCQPGKKGYYNISVAGEVVVQGSQFEIAETKLFSVRDPTCNHQVEVDITFDIYPEETSWDIQKLGMAGESTLIAGYNATFGETTYSGSVCLKDEEGQYRFTIYDTNGDGIGNEIEGAGEYIVILDGQVIAQGSGFDSSESTSFYVIGPT